MISVCIATHNGEKFIRAQIESILYQLNRDDEVIISDDGSTDMTKDIIESIGDKRIKLFDYVPNISKRRALSHYLTTSNFENALKYAKGDYIFISDQDDIWTPDKIRNVLPCLKAGYLVQTNYSIIDQNGNVIEKRYLKKNPISKSFLINLINEPFHGCSMAFPKYVLDWVLPFPKYLIMHDNWIGLMMSLMTNKIVFVDEPMLYYRRHNFNVTKGYSPHPLWFKISYRLIILIKIIKRALKIRYSKISD